MEPLFFETPNDFRRWLEKNHKTEKEVIVGFYKVGSGKKSMTWPESVDQALRFGWIDGVRRSIDKESYTNRFTPRRPTSNWSEVNIRKVEELTKKGLMMPAGIEAFEKRKDERSGVYSFENEAKVLDAEYVKKFHKNKKAWKYFDSLAPSYKKTAIYWVMSGKQEATRLSRLEKLIAASEDGLRLR